MMKTITDEQLIDYLEGGFDAEAKAELESRLAQDAELSQRLEEFRSLLGTMDQSREFEVPEEVSWNFKAALDEELADSTPKSGSEGGRWWMQIAAGLGLLVMGYLLGNQQQAPDQAPQLQALENQVQALQQTVMQKSLQSPSASERIQVVSQIREVAFEPDEALIQSLVKAATQDKSTNVRYAAVQALGNFIDQPTVRMELVRSLEQQDEPLIQIAMISLLVEAQEKTAISSIKKLLEDEATTEEVKTQAAIAIDILI